MRHRDRHTPGTSGNSIAVRCACARTWAVLGLMSGSSENSSAAQSAAKRWWSELISKRPSNLAAQRAHTTVRTLLLLPFALCLNLRSRAQLHLGTPAARLPEGGEGRALERGPALSRCLKVQSQHVGVPMGIAACSGKRPRPKRMHNVAQRYMIGCRKDMTSRPPLSKPGRYVTFTRSWISLRRHRQPSRSPATAKAA